MSIPSLTVFFIRLPHQSPVEHSSLHELFILSSIHKNQLFFLVFFYLFLCRSRSPSPEKPGAFKQTEGQLLASYLSLIDLYETWPRAVRRSNKESLGERKSHTMQQRHKDCGKGGIRVIKTMKQEECLCKSSPGATWGYCPPPREKWRRGDGH